VIFLAWHCWRVYQLMRASQGAQTMLVGKVSFRRILCVTFLLFLLFASRCVYNFWSAISDFELEIPGRSTRENIYDFLLFFLWEIIPVVLVLVLFGKVESTNLGCFSSSAARPVLLPTGYLRPDTPDINSGFHRWQRDDEDEATPFRSFGTSQYKQAYSTL